MSNQVEICEKKLINIIIYSSRKLNSVLIYFFRIAWISLTAYEYKFNC